MLVAAFQASDALALVVNDGHVSFDLAALAMGSSADTAAALAMVERCNLAAGHIEGEIDSRVTAFCAALATQFPIDGTHSPWAMSPNVGIDHVIMYLSWSPQGGPMIRAIQDLAAQHGLVLIDLQSDDVYLLGQGSKPENPG